MPVNAAPATCEEYDSDISDAVPDTRTQANVATKRTPSANSVETKTIATNGATPGKPTVSVIGPDGASDSGYSSHTAATIASADSAQSYKTGISSNSGSVNGNGSYAAARSTTAATASPRRRPSQPPIVIPSRTEARAPPAQSSPKKTQSRQSSRQRRDTVTEGYQDPAYARGRRPQPAPIQIRDRGYSYTGRGPPSSTYFSPPSPNAARHPNRYSGVYGQSPAVVQPEPPQRRRSTSTTRRPQSYHYGMQPGMAEAYFVQMQQSNYANAIHDARAPPLSHSAWSHTAPMGIHPPPQPYPMMSATPPNQTYLPPRALPSPTVPQRDMSRIPPDHAEGYSARNPRRSSLGIEPIILQDQASLAPAQTSSTRQYSARYPVTSSRSYNRGEETETSSDEDEDDDPYQMSNGELQRQRDRIDMPPPMMIPNRGHRSSQSYSARGTGPIIVNPIVPQTPPRHESLSRTRSNTLTQGGTMSRSPSRSSRRQSMSRPKPTHYYTYHPNSRDISSAHMHVERSGPVQSSGQRLRRRESYIADEPSESTKHKRTEKNAEAYIAAQTRGGSSRRASTYRRAEREGCRKPSRRHPVESETESESGSSSDEDEHPPQRSQSQRRPSRPDKVRSRTAPTQPLTEKALKRRSGLGGTVPVGSDPAASRTSSGRSIEHYTSAPASTIAGTTERTITNEGYKIRLEGGTVDFGDLGGRTLHIRHADNGTGGAEFVIGDAPDDEIERRTERPDRGRRERRSAASSSKVSRTSGSVAAAKAKRREVDLLKADKSSRKSSRKRRDVE